MKWALLLGLVSAACQSGSEGAGATGGGAGATAPTGTGSGSSMIISLPKATVTDAYKSDISNLCNSVQLSGADQKPKDERWTHLAMWLGPNIKTPEGREFLVAIQPLRGLAKVMALETESKRVGLAGCLLADEWRPQAPAAPVDPAPVAPAPSEAPAGATGAAAPTPAAPLAAPAAPPAP